jgi:ankyrin repeat protein
LGGELLADGRLTFDYAGRRAWAEWAAEPDRAPAGDLVRRFTARAAADVTGVTALMPAAEAGRADVARVLLDGPDGARGPTRTPPTAPGSPR